MTLSVVDNGVQNLIEIAGELIGEEFSVTIKGDNNRVLLGDQVSSHYNVTEKPRISIQGNNNRIKLGKHASLKNKGFIRIIGNNNSVDIGDHCSGVFRVDVQTDGGQIDIGEHTTCVGMLCALHEPQKIILGRDCMISAGVLITASDMHSLIDLETGGRINAGADVIVGEHVWLGYDCMVLKGVNIGSGSVIAAGAVVPRDVGENCAAAGNPARVVRENVSWDRRLLGIADGFSAGAEMEF